MIYFGIFSFSFIHLELKRQIHLYALVVPLKTIPDFRPKWSKFLPVFRPKQLKNHTIGAAHTCIAAIGEYSPGTSHWNVM